MSGYKTNASFLFRNLEKETLVGILSPGEHKVGIESLIDSGDWYKLTVISQFGDRNVGRVYKKTKTGDDLSTGMRGLLSATAESADELIEMSESLDTLTELLVGRSLRVMIIRKDRFLNIQQFGRTDEPIPIPKEAVNSITSFLFPRGRDK